MLWRPPDPSIPRRDYDPDTPNPGLEEIRRQKAAGVSDDDLDWDRAMAILNESHGKVLVDGKWVMEVPHSHATWEGDGA